MSDKTLISWSDATWNVVTGCTRVSEGCLNCYIERTPPFRMAGRRFDLPIIGGTTGVQLHEDRLTIPLHWLKPRRVFVCSLADLFHEAVPDEFIARVWVAMAATPQHTYQVLSKRHARMRSLLASPHFQVLAGRAAFDFMQAHQRPVNWSWPLPNVWVGASVESQQWADIRIPALLDTPAAVRWLSCEPLLGPVDLKAWLDPSLLCLDSCRGLPTGSRSQCSVACRQLGGTMGMIDWVVTGGESGKDARPMDPTWARSLRDQCAAAGIAFHHKQNGEFAPRCTLALCSTPCSCNGAQRSHPTDLRRVGKKAASRELDGVIHDNYPEVSRVQA
jgi:protein gp37